MWLGGNREKGTAFSREGRGMRGKGGCGGGKVVFVEREEVTFLRWGWSRCLLGCSDGEARWSEHNPAHPFAEA